jgi:hypothetical protein
MRRKADPGAAPAAPAAPAATATPPPAAARPPAPAPARAAPARPDPAAMSAALARGRGSFDACVSRALAAPGGAMLAGRRTALIVEVGPSGRARDAFLEDGDLDAAPLGACLRDAVAAIDFPEFEGEPAALRLPLVLGR